MYHATNNTFHKGDILDGSKSTQIGLRAFCMLDCSSFSLIESKDIQYIKDQYSSMCSAVGIGLLKEGLSKEEALVQGRTIVTSQIPERVKKLTEGLFEKIRLTYYNLCIGRLECVYAVDCKSAAQAYSKDPNHPKRNVYNVGLVKGFIAEERDMKIYEDACERMGDLIIETDPKKMKKQYTDIIALANKYWTISSGFQVKEILVKDGGLTVL